MTQTYREQVPAEIGQTLTARTRDVLRQYVPALVVFVVALTAWEALVRLLDIQFYLLPAPREIFQTFAEKWRPLLSYGLFTFREALFGFFIGCGSGILIALIVSRFPQLSNALIPYAVASNSVPIIAFAPLAIVWLGIGPASKIAIVAIITFFPTLVNTSRGLTSVPVASLELMRSYAATDMEIFRKLRLPNALPYIFSAFKICSTLAMIGAVVAEFFGGPIRSLGVYIKTEASLFHTREAWSAIIVACGLGILFYLVISGLERVVMPWHVSYRKR